WPNEFGACVLVIQYERGFETKRQSRIGVICDRVKPQQTDTKLVAERDDPAQVIAAAEIREELSLPTTRRHSQFGRSPQDAPPVPWLGAFTIAPAPFGFD